METRHYWEENGHAVKYESYNDDLRRGGGETHNFAIPSEDEGEYMPGSYLKKGKVSRQDPMSHRIIEKRRRDRMNNCLAELSRLIPPEYLKKGRGRVEKTEIIEMTIRHLKFLQERANAAERTMGEDHFRAGFREAMTEAVRFLVEIQGYLPGDILCVQLASHLQRHCEHVIKGDTLSDKQMRSHLGNGSSSETASSSSSSHGFVVKPSVIATARTEPKPTEQAFAPSENYEPDRAPPEQPYAMDCDRVPAPAQMQMSTDQDQGQLPEPTNLPLDGRRKRDATLRTVRKPDHDDYLHSYKFKNSIERRFSRSQDCEAADMTIRPSHNHGKVYGHKRRRATKPAPSTSTSNSGSTEDTRDNSPPDTSSESAHNHHYEKPVPPTQYVPIFALNALGKYYVPLSVEYSCLARHLGPYDMLDARAAHLAAPLHPVTIHVNFQPCLNYVKREPTEREWRPMSNGEYPFKSPTPVLAEVVQCGHR